jgi:hypothetical protein
VVGNHDVGQVRDAVVGKGADVRLRKAGSGDRVVSVDPELSGRVVGDHRAAPDQ